MGAERVRFKFRTPIPNLRILGHRRVRSLAGSTRAMTRRLAPRRGPGSGDRGCGLRDPRRFGRSSRSHPRARPPHRNHDDTAGHSDRPSSRIRPSTTAAARGGGRNLCGLDALRLRGRRDGGLCPGSVYGHGAQEAGSPTTPGGPAATALVAPSPRSAQVGSCVGRAAGHRQPCRALLAAP